MPRLKMQLSSRPFGGCSHKIRATELPTVPNPKIATFIGLSISTHPASSPTQELKTGGDIWYHQGDIRQCVAGRKSKVTELLFGHSLSRGPRCFPFEGAAYQVTRTQANGQCQREDDTAEQNAESEIDNRSPNRQVI